MQRKEEEEREEETRSTNGEGENGQEEEKELGGGEGKPQRKCFYGGAFPQILDTPQKIGGTRQSGDFLPKQIVCNVGDMKRVTVPYLFL